MREILTVATLVSPFVGFLAILVPSETLDRAGRFIFGPWSNAK